VTCWLAVCKAWVFVRGHWWMRLGNALDATAQSDWVDSPVHAMATAVGYTGHLNSTAIPSSTVHCTEHMCLAVWEAPAR